MSRAGIILASVLATMGVGYPCLTPMATKLIWNASASAPIGFYTIDFDGRFEVTDLVAVDAPEPLAAFLADRGYLPRGVPLLKRILGVSGQIVCRSNLTITVDGVEAGMALERDRAGRDLPVWQGCRRIPAGEVFLMNWQVRDSLDGRYFGLLSTSQIVGRAVPLWTDENGDGRFEWRVNAVSARPAARVVPPALITAPLKTGVRHATDRGIHAPEDWLQRAHPHTQPQPRSRHRGGRGERNGECA
ncbi:Conjugal transfer protein (modular protein) [Mesorhizobium metallidurans STM 2683]|uniref:Conjugal transfer protein (Modular protein) n=1 Tax=Mesorhizobium metallidurans STM 2683 TaxID=1297569 RepID=M5FB02_9HYPH|nr:Conjugal transfer protein (modular protein) [Mesorhizobium metallidurans STM 2683]